MSQEGFRKERADTGKDEWLTPPSVVAALGEFDLDPCAPIVRPWPTAKEHLTIDDDGLTRPWGAADRVWMNPPYGREVGHWLKKLAAHGNGIALIFARTETSSFFKHVWGKADGVFFIKSRLRFHHVDGTVANNNAGAPSCLIAYGKDNADVLRDCGLPGKFLAI